jgi:alanine dehydrogenase
LRQLDELFGGTARTGFSTLALIEEEISAADVVIGAVLVPGASAPKLVTRDMLSLMKQNTVLVDVAIDQGGCFETSRATTHADPTYVVDGIIHYCVANMPGAVPRTSSYALNNATLPFGLTIADEGLKGILNNPGLLEGLNVHRGMLTSQPVAESLNLEYREPREALYSA